MMTDDDQNDDQKVAIVANKFNCYVCDYNTVRKNNYIKHLLTAKHKMMTNDDQKVAKVAKVANFMCQCGKGYKYKQGLSVHKKKCGGSEQIVLHKEEDTNYKELIMKLIEQNTSLQNTITEMIPKLGNNNNNNNTNNIKQNFNVNIFLNEQCKDAISMDDFLKNIEISVTDLLFSKEKGLTKGISNIFINHLNKLPMIQRPLWCTDKKRKKLYIKEEKWLEDVDNHKTKNAITAISKIQTVNINKFIENKPNWMCNDNDKETYINIVKTITDPVDDKASKIIDNLLENIHLTEDKIVQ